MQMQNDKPFFLWQVFNTINGFVSFADTKAMGLLAAHGAIWGTLVTHISVIQAWIAGNPYAIAGTVTAITALLGSFCCALTCVWPRLSLVSSK